jgi:hypothetical protein
MPGSATTRDRRMSRDIVMRRFAFSRRISIMRSHRYSYKINMLLDKTRRLSKIWPICPAPRRPPRGCELAALTRLSTGARWVLPRTAF